MRNEKLALGFTILTLVAAVLTYRAGLRQDVRDVLACSADAPLTRALYEVCQ